jgi:leucyl-tRNA synthetase
MQKFPKRDFLVNLELKAQKEWENEKIHEAYASTGEKYFATFPYP